MVHKVRCRNDDSGEATLEFISVAVLLLIPIFYLIVTLAAVQGAAFATQAAATAASRLVVLESGNKNLAEDAVSLSLRDFGLANAHRKVTIDCDPNCGQGGAKVVVSVTASVPLPLLPDVFGSVVPLSIPVTSVQHGYIEKWAVP